jgi:hypothetical protein
VASRQQTLKLGAVAIAAAVLTHVLSSAGAAPITWSSPVTITGSASDVITTGTWFRAWKFNGSGTTVNGVGFTGLSSVTSGTIATSGTNLIITTTGTFSSVNNVISGAPSSTSVPDASYRSLLTNQFGVQYSSGTANIPNTRMQFTINGLTSGYQYVLQFWANQSSNNFGNNNRTTGRTVSVSSTTSGWSSPMLVNSTDTSGGVGQFVTGTFTADGSSQTFYTLGSISPGTTNSNANNYASALQVRLLAVPEPSTLVLASLGIVSVGTWFGRRRIRRAAEESSAADASITA